MLNETLVPLWEQIWQRGTFWYSRLQNLPPPKLALAAALALLLVAGVSLLLWRLLRYFRADVLEKAERQLRRGQLERALKLFLEANQPLRAAGVAVKLNRCLEAADLYRRGRDFAAAARLYALEGNFFEAAQLYSSLGKQQEAARMLERGGDLARALDLYQQLKIDSKVEELCQKLGQPQRAAEYFTAELDMLLQQHGGEYFEENQEQRHKVQRLAAAAGRYYQQAEQPLPAIAALEKGNLLAEVAALHEQLGNYIEATHFYRQAEMLPKAAEMAVACKNYEEAIDLYAAAGQEEEVIRVLELAGQKTEAETRRARLNLEEGKLREAAANFAKAGNFQQAAQLYAHIHLPAEAAAMLEQAGQPGPAAALYVTAGESARAAAAFEAAGDFRRAAENWLRAGNQERYLAMLERSGDFYPLAERQLAAGQFDQAVSLFQRVPRGHADYNRAAARLARLFLERGMLSLARGKLEEAIGRQPISRDNIELHYLLGLVQEHSKQWPEALVIYEKVMLFEYSYADAAERRKKLGQALSSAARQNFPAGGAAAAAPGGKRQVRAGEKVLDRYEVIKEIGRGGMGMVYLAQDKSLDRPVALKVLARDLTGNPDSVNLFFNEARAAAQLNHPNIVTIHDVNRWGDDYFIVMEYVRGVDLKELLGKNHPLPAKGVALIMKQVADGLDCAHRRGIFHRDIKNSNLLWTEDRLVKIADFGLAKMARDQGLTGGGIKGSPYYMAPEQILGEPVDARTDIYSLGVSAYELLCGTVPFSQGEVAYHHLHTQPVPLAKWRADVPPPLEAAVMKCLAKKPQQRFGRASELAAALKPLLD